MRALATAVATTLAILATASCRAPMNAQYGGDLEHRLVDATVAVDLERVRQLLASGADPNKMAPYQGHNQSPWKLALHQARSNRPDSIEIVRAMLEAHADPGVAWGEGPSPRGGYSPQRDTPVFETVSTDTPDVARALIKAGLKGKEAQNALELAVENGQTDLVHALVEGGIDVNSYVTAVTPLVAAIQTRNVALMIYLEDHGAREKP